MSLPDIDIESLIPHRDRIKMIGEMLEITSESAVATATVSSCWPLCDGNAVSPIVLIEVVAQTGAAIDGYKRKLQHKTGGKGLLVGIKRAHFIVSEIPVGTQIVASVQNSYTFEKYSVISATVKAGEEILAEIVLQALRTNEDPTKD